MLKRLLSIPLFTLLLLSVITANRSEAQCTTANINWDNLDYLSIQGAANANYLTYINTGALYTNQVQTQRFGIGTNRLTIATNYPSTGVLGENTTHTGETGSFGTGADINFTGNGTITMTFDTAVSAAQFSIYDLDASQIATVTAFKGVTPVPVVLTKPAGGNVTIVGNIGTGGAANQANNVNVATLNVACAGPLTSIVLVFTGTAGDYWISDIQACVYRSFINNYYTIAQPFTGQPAYVLAVHDLNTVFMVDPSSGRAVSLFSDNTPRVREINNIAYDPYKHIAYYSIDGLERCTPAGNPDSVRYIKKYDFNTETLSQIIANVNNTPFNIPTFSQGFETGGASFYNGSLYVGAEGKNTSSNSGRDAMVWRIDFAADSITPTQACQVLGLPGDDGAGNTLHDWGDFIIKDGSLYDFNTLGSGAAIVGKYNVYNMQTDVIANTYNGVRPSDRPRQAGEQWNGSLVWLNDSVTAYDGTNVLTLPKKKIVSAPRSVTWVAAAGDGAEAFRPKADFGDAPASYDPVALSPALNEKDTAIRIGAGYSWEWAKKTSANASSDNFDDGLAYVPIFAKSTNSYVAQVQVWNNSGGNATLCAWFDYNHNGVFDASEGITPITVATMASYQSFYLTWSGISTPLLNSDSTFLRIRFTSTTNTLTTAKATGYFNDGETEDYVVQVDDFPLSVGMSTFTAKAMNSNNVRLNWTTTTEENLNGFGIERSADRINWTTVGFVSAKGNGRSANTDYVFNDMNPLKGKSYYRLKISDNNTTFQYSEVRNVAIRDLTAEVSVMPNPAKTTATISISSDVNTDALIVLQDMQGRKLRSEKYPLLAGENSLTLNNLNQFPEGTYVVQIMTGQTIINRKLVIGKSIF